MLFLHKRPTIRTNKYPKQESILLAVYVCLIFLIEIGLLVLLCNQDIETTTSINRICKEFEKELSNSLLYGNVSCDTKSFILSKNKILSIKTDYWTNKYNLSEPIKIHINHNNDKFTIFVSYCGFKSNTYIINNALNFNLIKQLNAFVWIAYTKYCRFKYNEKVFIKNDSFDFSKLCEDILKTFTYGYENRKIEVDRNLA